MKINDNEKSVQGMRFSQIGKLLKDASPSIDGIGLKVELTEDEEVVFEEHFGMRIGYAISELIVDAIKADKGLNPGFQYFYVNRIFQTTATP